MLQVMANVMMTATGFARDHDGRETGLRGPDFGQDHGPVFTPLASGEARSNETWRAEFLRRQRRLADAAAPTERMAPGR